MATKRGTGKGRRDGWGNLLTGMGIKNRDKKTSTEFGLGDVLGESELTAMYRSEGFAKRIVDLPVDEMTREGFTVEGDEEVQFPDYTKKLDILGAASKALKWKRLFGGAIIVVGANDGRRLFQPLRKNGIRRVDFLRVYSRHEVDKTQDLERDPRSERFGLPNSYQVQRTQTGGTFKVHYSRAIEVTDLDLPVNTLLENNGWGDSVLQAMYERLRGLGSILSSTESIIDDFVTATVAMKNLADLIGAGREDEVQRRLNLMDMSRHVINTVLLDENETYTKESSSVAGLADLIDRHYEGTSAVAGIPMRVLFGKQIGGLNNNGTDETRDWYDKVASDRNKSLKPILEQIARFVMRSIDGPFKGQELEKWDIAFPPLWQQSAKEQSEIKKNMAEADQKYIDSGVLSPDEVAESRFGGDEFSTETSLDSVSRRSVPEGGDNDQ